MTIQYKQDHIPKSTQNNRRPATSMNATTITLHNTGNSSSTAQNERNWLTNPSNDHQASFHIVVDEKEAIECLPLNEAAWHSGDGSGVKSGNRTSIGIEICESGDYQKSLENAVELVAKMLKERGWGIDRLRRHFDWSAKICPRLMYDSGKWTGWFEFKNRVQKRLDELNQLIKPIPTSDTKKVIPLITKDRIYSDNGILKTYPIGTNKGIATDVRHIKFETGKVRYQFVYEKGAKVSDLVKKYGADYGFNAPFFYNGVPLGDTEDNDKVISSAYGKMLKWHEFAVVDGKPVIGQLDKSEKQDLLFQFAPLLVENGKPCYEHYAKVEEVNDDIKSSRCQRTFAWIDVKGDLHIGIADGRTSWDQGLNLEEMTLYAISKGAVIAGNFDGGGSTVLANQTGGLNQKENTGVNERSVHHALLVFVKTEEEIKKEKEKEIEEKVKKSLSKYFDDVFVGYQAPSIDYCKEKGYLNGVSDKEFKPESAISRGDLAVVLNRFATKIIEEIKSK